jgi:hypothetical protein
MTATVLAVWASAWLVIVVALTALSRRVGAGRAAAWLVGIGLFLLIVEEPLLTVWLAVTGPSGDPDGMAGLVTPMARAHVLDAAVVAIATVAGLGYVAFTGLPKGRRWAWGLLAWGFAVALATEVATTVLVFSRGLPLPGAGGDAGRTGIGWPPVAVGLLAWAIGLIVARPVGRADTVAAEPVDAAAALD